MFLEEDGADQVADWWDGSESVYCLTIGYLEVRGAIARRLTSAAARIARAKLDDDWGEVESIVVDDGLIARAADVIDRYRLRSLDSLHLAAALELDVRELVVASWDADLARAARAEGLLTAP